MKRYVGVCFNDSGQYWQDTIGVLLGELDDGSGWVVAAEHYSSGSDWSRNDIKAHYDDLMVRSNEEDQAAYKWVGFKPFEEIKTAYPAAPKPVEATDG